MSLIVVIQNKNGIVFASDSKSTRLDALDYPCEEKGRLTTKAFVHKNFLVGTYGRNTLVKDGFETRIENTIQDILDSSPEMNAKDFVREMTEACEESFSKIRDAEFFFLLGEKVAGGYQTTPYDLKNEMYTARSPRRDTGIFYYGIDSACPRNISVNPNWGKEEMEIAARAILKSTIAIGDCFYNYNPVGGKIQAVSFS